MRVRCGTFLYETIRILSKNCCNAIRPDVFLNPKLDKTACYNSKALDYYRDLAHSIVQDYENHVRLSELADPDRRLYTVGPYQPSGTIKRPLNNAGHPFYDAQAFRPDELQVAKGLDKYRQYVWVRNKEPHRLRHTAADQERIFFCLLTLTFCGGVKNTVWAIDPTGIFILTEKVRTKLLTLPSPLKIALLTRGQLSPSFVSTGDTGWSLVRFRTGNAAPENFQTLEEVLTTLVYES